MIGPEADIPAGTEFSHYRIVSKLESGGMGSVYLADDLSLERRVAVKFLQTDTATDPTGRERLLHEARATATAAHPSVVAVHEIAFFKDRPALVMEFVEGEPLHRLIQRGPLPAAEAVDLARQLCVTLAAVHKAGLVHGDIKPANLILDSTGRLRILDFGIAHLIAQTEVAPRITSGTVGYSAPEVLSGASPGPGSDLFSVGVVLYELLTGVRAFSGAYDAAVAYSVVNEQPAPISSHVPDIPPALEAIVGRLLEKLPANRYRSAKDVLTDLDRSIERRQRPRASRWRTAALVGSGFVIAVLLWGTLSERIPDSGSPPALAVLPFENLGPAGDEYFADGITDEVTACIARNPSLSVISRNSSRRYKGVTMTTREIGQELGADYLVVGAIHWERSPGNRVRINAQLIQVDSDVARWSESYEGDLAGVFDMQRRVAQAVGRALDLAMGPDAEATHDHSPTGNLAAYDYYLRGSEYFNRSWDRSDIEAAGSLYRRAVALDSTYASAWAMLSRVEASIYWEYFDHSQARCEAAYAAARHALALDPDLPEGHEALGYCYYHCDRDYARAVAQWEQGLARDPNNAELENALAAVYRRQGDLEKAATGFTRALQLDPRSHLKAFDLALTYGMMRRFTESDRYLRRAIELAPDYPLAHIYRAWLPILRSGDVAASRQIVADAGKSADLTQSKYYWWLLRLLEVPGRHEAIGLTPATDTVACLLFRAQAYRLEGNKDRERIYADSARVLLESRLAERLSEPRYLSDLGMAWAGLGNRELALANAARAVELLPTSREAFDAPFYLLNLAEVMVIFGDYDAAVEQLTTLLSIPGFASAAYLRIDPLWEPLRTHPGFQQLVAGADQSAS